MVENCPVPYIWLKEYMRSYRQRSAQMWQKMADKYMTECCLWPLLEKKKWTTEIVPKMAHEHSSSQFPDLPATEPEATTILFFFLKGC